MTSEIKGQSCGLFIDSKPIDEVSSFDSNEMQKKRISDLVNAFFYTGTFSEANTCNTPYLTLRSQVDSCKVAKCSRSHQPKFYSDKSKVVDVGSGAFTLCGKQVRDLLGIK